MGRGSGRDSQDFDPARQERDKAHEARYAQLFRLLGVPLLLASRVQKVVQAYIGDIKQADIGYKEQTGWQII